MFCILIIKFYISMAVKIKQYTFFCSEMFSVMKYPWVKLLDRFYFSSGIAQYHLPWNSLWFYYHACSSLNHCRGCYVGITKFDVSEMFFFIGSWYWYISTCIIISLSGFTLISFCPESFFPLLVVIKHIVLYQLH